MKDLLISIVFLIVSNFCFGQKLEGIILDETRQPLAGASVLIKGTTKGTVTDTNGCFQLDFNKNDTLLFNYFSYKTHQITNIPINIGITDIGKIQLVNTGFSGYLMVSKKRFLSQKTKTVCKYVDSTREIKPEDLVVKCSNEGINYTWSLNDNETLSLDYTKVKVCE